MTAEGPANLKALLARGVAERRRQAEADQPRPGRFDHLRHLDTIHFATTGRRTGQRHTKWWIPFAPDGDTLYLIEEVGTRADWVKNALHAHRVDVWGKDEQVIPTTPRVVTDRDELERARRLVHERFGGGSWNFVNEGLVIALDLV